jgi:hypothetical protein
MQLFGNHLKGKTMKKLFGLIKISSLLLFFFASSIPAFAAYDGSKRISDLNPPPYARGFGNQTYRVVVADFSPASAATDVLVIQGSATKTIRITHIEVTADATVAAVIGLYEYKRIAANTGGTSTLQTAIPMDSTNSAATATVSLYTANPSALGSGALIAAELYELPAVAGNSSISPPWVLPFEGRNTQAAVLHGAAESLAFSLKGATLPAGLSVHITVEWTEE